MNTRPAILLASLILLWQAHYATASTNESRVVYYDARTMGTVGTVALVSADSARTAPLADLALREFTRVDSLMSNWISSSEVSRINRSAHPGPVRVDRELFGLIAQSRDISLESQRAFDITVEPLVRLWGFLGGGPRVPDPLAITRTLTMTGIQHVHLDHSTVSIRFDVEGVHLDLGGIAKGYAVDRATQALVDAGVAHALVNLSGNMAPLGHPPLRESWKVGLRDPDSEFGYFATLLLGRDCIATSGNYEQFAAEDGEIYGHILDPRDGWPARGLDAVTVLAPTATEADAWATAFMVMGPEEARRVAAERDDLAAVLVQSASGGPRLVWAERQLRSRLHAIGSVAERFEIQWFGSPSAEE